MTLNPVHTPTARRRGRSSRGRASTSTLIAAACLALVAATGCTSAASTPAKAAPQAQKTRSDQQINNAVEDMLLTDSVLSDNQIDATTSDGVVTFTGTAENLMAKERAAKLAQTLRGVRGVVNTTFVRVASVSNDALRKNVESALGYDAATHAYELKAEAKDGVVTLTGTVQSHLEKQLAVSVAKGVAGVKEVRDTITVKLKGDRPDTEIAAEVKRILSMDAWLQPNLISTDVKNGIVTLTGDVGSAAQYERASLLAWTAGVISVNAAGLKVEPWVKASSQRAEMIAMKSDPDIKQAVHDTFVSDPRVLAFNPTVEVTSGVVTLTGVVDNLRAKRAAEQDAKNTVGVGRVANLLKVRPVVPLADEQIAQNVKSAFALDALVDNYQIDVKARRGVVTLTGTVDSYYDKAEADDIASRAVGVIDVKNDVSVSHPEIVYYNTGYDPYWSFPSYYSYYEPFYHSTWAYRSDTAVKDAIEDRLFWSPFVPGDRVVVNVDNGVATLTGTVDSWFASSRATEDAYEGGAWQVFNHLKVT